MMNLTVKKKIGKSEYDFTFSGNNLWDVVMELEKLSFPNVAKCGLCDSEYIRLTAYKAQDKYKYVKIVCSMCKGSVTFGQRQEDPNVFFLRKNDEHKPDWKKYEQKEVSKGEEDIPF